MPQLQFAVALCLWVILAILNQGLSSVIDEQICADRVEKDCGCKLGRLLYAVRGPPDKHWCHGLQACAHCMSVPRCSSRYLDRFRSLLLATSILSSKTGACPGLRYGPLMELIKGSKKSCKGSGTVYDQCGQRCKCQYGKLTHCYRVRREFTRMSFEERSRYVGAFYKATTNPVYKDDFEQLLNQHSRLPSKYLHHMPQIFFPWHRWYLLKIESFLKQIDCRVTIPYFQWTAKAGHVFRTSPSDVWASGLQGLGGNGVPPRGCVQDGLFRESNWFMPLNKGGGCLERAFNYSCVLPDERHLRRTLGIRLFLEFENEVRDKYHNYFHDCVGRLMHEHHTASNTPEFPLHHGFMDKIWDSWQKQSGNNMFEYYTSENYRMPLADRYPWEYLNNDALPSDLRVYYEY